MTRRRDLFVDPWDGQTFDVSPQDPATCRHDDVDVDRVSPIWADGSFETGRVCLICGTAFGAPTGRDSVDPGGSVSTQLRFHDYDPEEA